MERDRLEGLIRGIVAVLFLMGVAAFGIGILVALWVGIYKVWCL